MEWDEWNPDDEYEGYPRDAAIDAAKEVLAKFFAVNRDAVFYLTQLQVTFEKPVAGLTAQPIFHWITAKAVSELVESGELNDDYQKLSQERGTRVRFIFHPRLRYTRRMIENKLKLIRRFSDPAVARACGHHSEILFSRAIFQEGFRGVARNANHFQDKKWEETGHNLDFIFDRDGVSYGCEIKNRFEYITREEMRLKIRLCKFLGLRPLFILRSAPKNYIYEIRNSGGFTKIFDWHIYPYGMEKLTESIRSEFPGLPAYCVNDLPDTIMRRFVQWHSAQQPNQ
jgi:hypothetical protein